MCVSESVCERDVCVCVCGCVCVREREYGNNRIRLVPEGALVSEEEREREMCVCKEHNRIAGRFPFF